jgi:hypothetical protein
LCYIASLFSLYHCPISREKEQRRGQHRETSREKKWKMAFILWFLALVIFFLKPG